jgi:HEAT repeat protein
MVVLTFLVVLGIILYFVAGVILGRREEREKAEEAVREEREKAKEAVRKHLEEDQAKSRMAQLKALVEEVANSDDKAAFERLLEFLITEDRDELRVAALEALGEQCKSGHDPAFNALLGLLQTEHADLSALVATKLGELRDPRAIDPLLRELWNPNKATHYMTEALAQMIEPGDERVVEMLCNTKASAGQIRTLSRFLKPGDERVAQVLWDDITDFYRREDRPVESLTIWEDLLIPFGDARAVASLVATAREWIGIDSSDWGTDSGSPCYGWNIPEVVEALEQILKRDARNVSLEALRSVLELDDFTIYVEQEGRRDHLRELISCGTIHRLAREELQRRGLEP